MSSSDYTALRRISQINAFYNRQPGFGFDQHCNCYPQLPQIPQCGPIIQYVPVLAGCENFGHNTGTATGGTGTIGAQGPQGPQGNIGPQGLQGNNGTNGSQGPQGNNGTNGPQGPQGNNGTNGPQGPQGPAGPAGSGGSGGVSSTSNSYLLQLYYKITNSTSGGSLLLSDISHNLPSSLKLYFSNASPYINYVYIEDTTITTIDDSFKLLPSTAFKEFALNYTNLGANGNPILTWNSNKIWGYGTVNTISSIAPSVSLGSCYAVPIPTSSSDITLTNVRNLSTASLTTGTASTVAASSTTVTPGTFTGNILSIGVGYNSAGIAAGGAISTSGISEVAQGSNIYVNLANIYLTF